MRKKRVGAVYTDYIKREGIEVKVPVGMEEKHLYYFEFYCNRCVKNILSSYRAKNPQTRDKYLNYARTYLRFNPEVYEIIKEQLDYKYSQ